MENSLGLGDFGRTAPTKLVEQLKQLVPWKNNWTEMPAEIECNCGFSGQPKILEKNHGSFTIECPECKEVPILLSGTDFRIIS